MAAMARTFENKIVIDGTLCNPMEVTEFPDDVQCEGVKSSVYNKDDKSRLHDNLLRMIPTLLFIN